MGVIVDEEYGTQIEKTRGEKTTIRRRFCVFADCDFDAYLQIRNFIVANYSESIESLSVTEDNETTRYWRGECTFSSPDPKDLLKEKGIPEYSFSTKGGSAHITQSRKTVKVYRGWRAKYEYVEEPDKKGNVTKKLQIVKDEHGNPVLEKETPKDYKGGIGWN
ncbi:MAG: hypothetical protein LBL62_06230, partial [Planctomycetaceae bacterium]|nr:hypothetical protein [Planctomycetaceae bacterium]